ncbi:MAG: helix-turn-helix transcriptional regulator [Sedimentisphaerales bacterium]|nr:helix-turn-helix transcriptional regulator [Sedimentisphaerales bacterium]
MNHIKTGNIDPKDLLIEMAKMFRSYDAEFFPSNENMSGIDLSSTLTIKEGEADLNKYVDHYWQYDPLYSAQFSTEPINRVFKTDDIIPYSQLQRLDYYRDYLQHINWFGELVIRLCTENGFWGTMSISRSPKQPYFDQADIQKAELLLPYLISTFEATMFFSKINGERKVFERWLESRPEGVVLLDSKLNAIFSNNRAKQICLPLLGQKPVPVSQELSNEIILPETMREDCLQLINSHDTTSCFSHNRIISTQDGERYYVKYTLINQPCEDLILPYFIININGLTKNADKEEIGVVLIKDYGLSEREEKIAQYVGLGLTNKEIGEKLGISQFTVQSHLRNIFEKTGIKRRSQLANIIK